MQFIIQHLPSLFRISNVHSTFLRAADTHSCLPLLVVALSPVNLWLHNHHPPSPLLSMVGCYVIIILRLLRLSATLFCLLPPSCNHPRSRCWPPAALTTHNRLPAATLHVNKSKEIDLMMYDVCCIVQWCRDATTAATMSTMVFPKVVLTRKPRGWGGCSQQCTNRQYLCRPLHEVCILQLTSPPRSLLCSMSRVRKVLGGGLATFCGGGGRPPILSNPSPAEIMYKHHR